MVRHARNDSPSSRSQFTKFTIFTLFPPPTSKISDLLKPKAFFTPKCLGQFVIINEFQHSTLFSSKASIIFEFVPLFIVVREEFTRKPTIIYTSITTYYNDNSWTQGGACFAEWAPMSIKARDLTPSYMFMFNRSSCCCVYLRHVLYNFPSLWNAQ